MFMCPTGVYVPYWQNAKTLEARLCVRVSGDPAAMLPRLTREVNRVDPDIPVAETITLPVQLDGIFRPLRVSATFLGYVADISVLLSAIGLYGVLAFGVSRRTKEIGIRMALGAEPNGIRAMIVREGMAVILFGMCAGTGLAMAGVLLIRNLVSDLQPGIGSFTPARCRWLYAVVYLRVGFLHAGQAASHRWMRSDKID